jgi:hypothetical protein
MSVVATRLRDRDQEREFINEAAAGTLAGGNTWSLIRLAQGRADGLYGEYVPHPDLVRLDVDQPREVREELADAAIRLTWWLQDNLEHRLAQRRFNALRLIVLGFYELEEDAE